MMLVYPAFVLASLFMTALTCLLAPLLALFVNPQTGNLPRCLYYFQTFDASCFEGRNPQYGFTGSNWWVATRWLWRNPAYGFDYWPFGIAFVPAAWTVTRSDATWFVAKGPYGQFNVEYGGQRLRLKLGWKAANYFDATTGKFRTTSWGPEMRTSLCFTISPRFS